MEIKRIFICIFLASLTFGSNVVESLENSIIPSVENSEVIDHLSINKYSKNQFEEITTALQRKDERLRIVSFNMLANDTDNKREEFNRWPQRFLEL